MTKRGEMDELPRRVVFWPPDGSGVEAQIYISRVAGGQHMYQLEVYLPKSSFTLPSDIARLGDAVGETISAPLDSRQEVITLIEDTLNLTQARVQGLTAVWYDGTRHGDRTPVTFEQAIEFLMAPFKPEGQAAN